MLLYGNWLALDINTRIKLASEFGISKTGSTHVQDNIIRSDGFSIKEIENKINTDSMKKYLETDETNLETLWNMTIDKVQGKKKVVVVEKVEPIVVEKPPVAVPPLPKNIYNQEPIIEKRKTKLSKTK